MAASAALAFLLSGFSGVAKLEPYSMREPYEQIFNAPVVVVGVLLSDASVRHPVPSRRNGGYPMQLRQLSIRVENTLRGNLSDGTTVVYYFALAGAYDGPPPLGQWRRGDRRILWLRQDSGVLRTACDGHDSCTMPVRSGAHLQYKPDLQKPLAYSLADIFLTRGDGTTDSEFATGVEWGAPSTVPEAYLSRNSSDSQLPRSQLCGLPPASNCHTTANSASTPMPSSGTHEVAKGTIGEDIENPATTR
jgi:hypothetical protein